MTPEVLEDLGTRAPDPPQHAHFLVRDAGMESTPWLPGVGDRSMTARGDARSSASIPIRRTVDLARSPGPGTRLGRWTALTRLGRVPIAASSSFLSCISLLWLGHEVVQRLAFTGGRRAGEKPGGGGCGRQ